MMVQSNEIEKLDETNNLILQFNFQRIEYNGQTGFFITDNDYSNLVNLFNNYLYMQDELTFLRLEMDTYWELERKKRRWQNAFGISIAVNISLVVLTTGICFFCYSIAKQ